MATEGGGKHDYKRYRRFFGFEGLCRLVPQGLVSPLDTERGGGGLLRFVTSPPNGIDDVRVCA